MQAPCAAVAGGKPRVPVPIALLLPCCHMQAALAGPAHCRPSQMGLIQALLATTSMQRPCWLVLLMPASLWGGSPEGRDVHRETTPLLPRRQQRTSSRLSRSACMCDTWHASVCSELPAVNIEQPREIPPGDGDAWARPGTPCCRRCRRQAGTSSVMLPRRCFLQIAQIGFVKNRVLGEGLQDGGEPALGGRLCRRSWAAHREAERGPQPRVQVMRCARPGLPPRPPPPAAACSPRFCTPRLPDRTPPQLLLLCIKLEEMENVESVSLPGNATFTMTVRLPNLRHSKGCRYHRRRRHVCPLPPAARCSCCRSARTMRPSQAARTSRAAQRARPIDALTSTTPGCRRSRMPHRTTRGRML